MERMSMRCTREVLRQKWGLTRTHRDVAMSLGLGIGTITAILQRAEAAGLSWAAVEGMPDEELEARLGGPRAEAQAMKVLPDPREIHVEMRRPGVTLALLHQEYLEAHPGGYQYTQFCEYYHRWEKRQRLTMRQTYRGGEKLFVDYAGQTIAYQLAGFRVECQLFVAVLGASSYVYAEATHSQRLVDFMGSHVRAFAWFGGVPGLVVPDQLKSAVTRADRYEPGLNRTYGELARHYGTCVMPARPAKPRDKAKVEAAVLVAERWILARLRHETFFSLHALNTRIAELLEDLNGRTMRAVGLSRRQLFERLDKPFLKALPATAFEYAEWKQAKVSIDYHVDVGRHYYSVPFSLVGEVVDVRMTASTVELFMRSQRVAVHRRSSQAGRHTTVPEHMPAAHRAHAEWSPSRLVNWAGTVGPQTRALAEAILAAHPHPEQGYRSCLGIMRLEKRYGAARVEAACARALQGGARSYTSVDAILVRGLDRVALVSEPVEGVGRVPHAHVRGPAYYDS